MHVQEEKEGSSFLIDKASTTATNTSTSQSRVTAAATAVHMNAAAAAMYLKAVYKWKRHAFKAKAF